MKGEIIISDEYMGYKYFLDVLPNRFSLDIFVSKETPLENALNNKKEFEKIVNAKIQDEKLLGYINENEITQIEFIRDNFDNILDYVDCFKIYNVNLPFRTIIDNNPIMLKKKIVLLNSFNICDYEKIKELASNNLDIINQLYIYLEGNENYVSIIDALKTIEEIHNQIGFVKSLNLSQMETIMFLYDYVRNRVYKYEDEKDDYKESRDLSSVLFGDKIVCVGYTNLFNSMLNFLGINAESVYYDGKDNEISKSSGHVRSIIKVNDPKYDITGIYLFDPTWDSKESSNSDNYLYSYKFFARNISFMEPYDRCCNLEQNKYLKYYNCKYYLPLRNALKNNDKEALGIFVESLNHFSRRITGTNLINPLLTFSTSSIDNKTSDYILERFMFICSYLKKNISAEKMLRLVSNVRKIEYYNNPNNYPYTLEDLGKILIESRWRFKNSHLSNAEKFYLSVKKQHLFKKRTLAHDFYGFIDNESIEKDIEQTRLCRVLRNVLTKKEK